MQQEAKQQTLFSMQLNRNKIVCFVSMYVCIYLRVYFEIIRYSVVSLFQQQVLNSVSNLHLLLSSLQVRWLPYSASMCSRSEMKWCSFVKLETSLVWNLKGNSNVSDLSLCSCISQAVVVQQDSFIEDQRQALNERSSSCTSLSRPSSRPSSLIEQEKQRSLEKQRQELASLQRQQSAHAEEKRRREKDWEIREQHLAEKEVQVHVQVLSHHFLPVLSIINISLWKILLESNSWPRRVIG